MKLFIKWLLWLVILFVGITLVYWFSDTYRLYIESLSNNSLAEGTTLTDFYKPAPFIITTGILCLIYCATYIIYEILNKFNIKIAINKN